MITLRKSLERGYFDHGWLQSFHSFSFSEYFDRQHMAWGNLRVINEDWVAPGKGFGTHPHRDMEIVTYLLEGALSHEDSMGNASTIQVGEVQRMSAGTGVLHSEFNRGLEKAHLLQIWLLPDQKGGEPGYEQKTVAVHEQAGHLVEIAARQPSQTAVTIRADARIFAGLFNGADIEVKSLDPSRKAYVFLARGQLEVNGLGLRAGDGLYVAEENALKFSSGVNAEVLVFDLKGD